MLVGESPHSNAAVVNENRERIEEIKLQNEPEHYKTNKMTCAPNKDSDQLGHPLSLI